MPNKVFIYEGIDKITILKWKVKAGFAVNQIPLVLFTYRQYHSSSTDSNNLEQKFKINKSGIIVKKLLKNNGDIVEANDNLFEYEICSHPTLMKDLCAVCGVNIDKFDSKEQKKIVENTSVSMVHSIPELRVSKEIAEDLGRADEERLLKYRKLVLLVDLDQTIVHSTNQNIPNDLSDEIYHYQLYGPNSPWYHTKFRPYMHEFLEEISKYYELHICTFGARRYAHQIANLIDPKCKFFPKDRILSRDEFFDPRSKTGNMKSLFPCGDSMVCIIDDRIDVWNYAPNVVQVKPYLCFKTDDINAPEKLNLGFENIKDDFDLKNKDNKTDDEKDNKTEDKKEKNESNSDQSKSKSTELEKSKEKEEEGEDCEENSKESDKDCIKPQISENKNEDSNEENKKIVTNNSSKEYSNLFNDKDDYLLYLKDILIKIHRKYYEEYDEKIKYRCEGEEILIPDLKEIIPSVRKTVLHSVNIVFTGVIATNISPNLNRYYRLAESLGAIVTKDIILNGSPKTTHLIAAKWGTVKVNKCLKYKHIKIVTPDWLLACADRWERVEEDLFSLNKNTVYNINEKEDYKKVHYDFSDRNKHHPNHQQQSSSKESDQATTMLDFSPLSNFSMNDLNDMGKEVADACSESGEDDDDDNDDDDDEDEDEDEENRTKSKPNKNASNYIDDDDEESLNYAHEGEYPRGWKDKETTAKRGFKRSNSVFDEDEEVDADDVDEDEDEDDEGKVCNQNLHDEDLSLSTTSSSEAESIGSVDEEMAAALEKEFFNS